MGTPRDSEITRAKLIEAAGRLFAEKGFKGVTVREIAAQAKTHLSALNYHFRTKELLYREAILEACRAVAFSEEDMEKLLGLDPEEALYIIIAENIKGYRDQGRSSWKGDLITRECWHPSSMFDDVVDMYIKPQTDLLAQVLSRIVDRPAEDLQVRFGVIGLVGLIDAFGQYSRFNEAVAPGISEYLNEKDRLVRLLHHLTVEMAKASPDGGPGTGLNPPASHGRVD